MIRRLTFLLVAPLLVLAAACSDDSGDDAGTGSEDTADTGGDSTATAGDGGTTTTVGDGAEGSAYAVFSGQGNNLVAYSPEPPFESQRIFTNAGEDPENGRDINAQICFWDDPELGRLFIAGEDTNQPDPPAGWGIFRLDGTQVGDFAATQIGKLTPTYQDSADGAENYGCGLLSDGRMVATDVGNQAGGPATGQLIIWFPPFDTYEVPYCKIDVEIGTAQSILVDDDDNVYVASSFGRTPEEPAGVYRFSGPFPTGPTPDEGCETTDATDAPMTEAVTKELFIPTSQENGLGFPAGLAWTPDGGMYVSSVANGVINEYSAEGEYVRTILRPPEGESMDEDSFSTGTPLGIGVGPDGTLFMADIGVVRTEAEEGQINMGPGNLNGNVRRITFGDDGAPSDPEVMDEGLAFPDGIGIFIP
jgi:sugar lactone lactonase YvrE